MSKSVGRFVVPTAVFLLGVMLLPTAGHAAATGGSKNPHWGWDARLNVGAGYDDNPFLDGSDVVDPEGDTHLSVGVLGGYWYDPDGKPLELSVSFGVSQIEQSSLDDANLRDSGVLAGFGWDFTAGKKRGFSLLAGLDLLSRRLGGDSFLDRVRFVPDLTYRWGEGTHRVSLYGSFEDHDDRQQLSQVEFDRTGNYSTVGVRYIGVTGDYEKKHILLRPLGPDSQRFSVGLARSREPTDGSEFQRTARILDANARLPITGKGEVTLNLYGQITESEYDETSILEPGIVRDDTAMLFGAGVSIRLPPKKRCSWMGWRLHLGAEQTLQSSNIPEFDYRRTALAFSLEAIWGRPKGDLDTGSSGAEVPSDSSSSGPRRPRTSSNLMPAP